MSQVDPRCIAMLATFATACGGLANGNSGTSGDSGGPDAGECRRPCAGTCLDGRCLTKLASDYAGAGIAVNSSAVFWTADDGRVRRLPLQGGLQTTLASKEVGPSGITLDAVNAYWIDYGSGGVVKEPLGGGTRTTLTSQKGIYIAVDETNVYWTNDAVMKVPKAGGTPLTLATGDLTLSKHGIAVNSTDVYWAEFNYACGGTDQPCSPGLGRVMRVPVGGGTPSVVASRQSGADSIALDATHVYWTNYNEGTVMSVPLAGGKPTTLASGQVAMNDITVDATSVYWTKYVDFGSHNGAVMKVALAGGTPVTLASAQTPTGIAVDDTSLYWLNLHMGVMRLTPK
jgi:hypothetical protein